jgi:hypothetical protein
VFEPASKGPEAREEDGFEQVSGPVNQPEPRNPMIPDWSQFPDPSRIPDLSQIPDPGSRPGLQQLGPSAARAFSNQGDSFALGGGASAINGLPSQTKNGKAAKKHHTT